VLIYRYFGDFDGLLKTVAESRHWVPQADDILNALSNEHSSTISVLRSIHQEINTYFRSEPCLLQLLRWRRADKSPLGQKFNSDWHSLWVTIPKALSQNLDYPQRQLWSHACSLLALVIEAELCGERIDLSCLEQLAEQLEPSEIEQYAAPSVVEVESLPTNLL
jgi:hypothetical protein